MSGILQRCGACGFDMVVERRHAGRTVPCPRCKAANDIPAGLDFLGADVASARDRARAGWLLAGTVFAGMACCAPASAVMWWQASGALHRSRDEGREPESLLVSTRTVAVLFTVLNGGVWLVFVVWWLRRGL